MTRILALSLVSLTLMAITACNHRGPGRPPSASPDTSGSGAGSLGSGSNSDVNDAGRVGR